MKSLLTTAVGLISYIASFATAQHPDILYFNGKKYSLHSNPLESYFELHPDKRPKGGIQSTALWRGYVATFEIKDSQLYVKDIEIEYWDSTKRDRGLWKSVLNEVFPEGKMVKVDWLTGLLVVPFGKLVNYVHMGYGSTYQHYFVLEINKGDFIQAKRFNHKQYEQFKEKQFLAYKQTEEYQKTKGELKEKGYGDEFIDDFLRSFVISYTSKILVKD